MIPLTVPLSMLFMLLAAAASSCSLSSSSNLMEECFGTSLLQTSFGVLPKESFIKPVHLALQHTDDNEWSSDLSTEFISSISGDIIRCKARGLAGSTHGPMSCAYETGGRLVPSSFNVVSFDYDNGELLHPVDNRKLGQVRLDWGSRSQVIYWNNSDTWSRLDTSPLVLNLQAQPSPISFHLCGTAALMVLVTILASWMAHGLPEDLRNKLISIWNEYSNPGATMVAQDSKIVETQHGQQIPEAATPGGVVALFEKQVSHHPNDIALLEAEETSSVTYSELSQLVDLLAAALKERIGIRNGDVVALLMQPSRSFVVATLAVMKVGAAWLPLDMKSPGPRLQLLLQRAGACVAFAQEEDIIASLAPFPTCTLSAGGMLSLGTSTKALQLTRSIPHDTAAIFYTSGSSGEPKAVIYGHDTICHGALTFGKLCQADTSSIFLMKTPTIWAVTEYEVFTPLIFGAKVVMSADSQRDIAKLAKTICDHKVSILATSAPVLQLLASESLPSLRHAVNVGAAMPLETCTVVQKAFGQPLSLHNIYGCTETPCLQWTYDTTSVVPGQKLAPAGVPQAGAEVQVLDCQSKPVPLGELGEIFIGGPFLSLGYLGDKSLTDERFLTMPGGCRFYRTGDAGRWVHDAAGRLVLQVEGRTDRQLNINGIRVSPEEIEGVLLQVSGVQEVAVVGRDQSIVAGIAGSGLKLKGSVEQHAKEHLPAHMRPAVLLLDCLPKLSNGKIDLVSMSKLASEMKAVNVMDQEGEAVEVLDSLGLMRKVRRNEVHEQRVISALRGWAALQVMLYHYWTIDFNSNMEVSIEFNKILWASQGPYYFRVLLTGILSLDGALPLFIMLSSYADSKLAPKTKWRENLVMLVLVIACRTLLPKVFGANPAAKDYVYELSGRHWIGNHRWYMIYVILCNLLHSCFFLPLRERVPQHRLAIVKGVSILMILSACPLLDRLDYCSFGLNNSEGIMQYITIDPCKLIPRATSDPSKFSYRVWLFPLYAVVWWYGPDLVAHFGKCREKIPKSPLPLWPLATLALLCMGYWAGEPSGKATIHGSELEQLGNLVSVVFASLTILVFALGSESAWFPLASFDYLGRCSLGTYIIHWFVVPLTFGIPTIPELLPMWGGWPGDGLLKFVVCILYCAFFAATVGCVFQICLVDGTSFLLYLLGQAMSWARPTFHSNVSNSFTPAQKNHMIEVKRAHQQWQQLCTSCFNIGGVLCIDGGTGSEVEREVEKLGHGEAVDSEGWSCIQWKTHPNVLKAVHMSYFDSGANLVISNSYATNRHIMAAAGYEELTCKGTLAAVGLACEARDACAARACSCHQSVPNLVAGSMSCHPPGMAHGASMDMGKWPAPQIESQGYREQAQLLRVGGADVIFVEMVWEWKEHGIKAVQAAVASGLPVIVCLSVFNATSCDEEMPQLHDGTLVEDVAKELGTREDLKNIVGICVHHTKLPLVLPCLMAIRRGGWEGIVGAYPDHGTFEMPHWRFEALEAEKIVSHISEWVSKANCQMVGGCCGIGPETIKIISEWCQNFNASKGIQQASAEKVPGA